MRKALLIVICFGVILLSAERIDATGSRLIWDPNTEPDLAGYKIYYGISSGNYPNIIDIGKKNCHLLVAIPRGTYYFAATAYNTSGNESGFSNEVSASFLLGDINGDGRNDGMDLITIGLYFGQIVPATNFECSASVAPSQLQIVDINGDGRIDGLDLIGFGLHFGESQ